MYKMIQLFAIALIINLLVSCKKDSEPTVYSGRLLEAVSNKPIANAHIDIKLCSGSFNTGQLSCTTIDSTTTDGEGNFSYPVPNATKYTSLDFFASKQHYYKGYGTNFYGTGAVKKDIFLEAKAWLDLRMVREAPFDEYCVAVLGPNSPKFTLNGCKGPTSYYQYEGVYQERGNDTLKIRWEVHYLNITTVTPPSIFNKSIYLKGLDTIRFELKF